MDATGGLRPTSEQLAVIGACASGVPVVVEAGAGTGKTSVLRMATAAMRDQRGAYIAFTRATAEAARQVFPPSVTCVTAHALAYRAVGYRYAGRLPGAAPRMPSWAVARALGIETPLPLGDNLLLTPAHQARIALATVARFCASADPAVTASHVPPVPGVHGPAAAELSWRITPLARQAWRNLRDPAGRLPFTHDHYLKLWQLGQPVIAGDFIMFDEAQDANPVTAAIVQAQAAQQVIVGDSCQAIYGWRGATDALTSWPCQTRLHLTESFRFGPAIAVEANKWLTALGAPYLLSGTRPDACAVGPVADPEAIVCRTNAGAFLAARAAMTTGQRVALGGGTAALKELAAASLDMQAAGRTTGAQLAAFRSWQQVRDYARTDLAGADLSAAIRLIDTHGASTVLGVLDALRRPGSAEVVACTAHYAKGREWERVRIASDFPLPPASGTVKPGEAMLGYVAVTRARSSLDRTGLAWIDHQPLTATRTEAPAVNQQPVTLDSPVARPYAGGRAQAESGNLIIATDYAAWTAIAGPHGDDPLSVRLLAAWRAIGQRDLDDPGSAATRYQVLAHAATAVAATPAIESRQREAAALTQLASHARLHAGRLRATAEDLFARSAQAGPYEGGIGQAALGSRIVEKDYVAWSRTGDLSASPVTEHVTRVTRAWEAIRVHHLSDGPAPAATRYTELADACSSLADAYPAELPSAGLGPLLDLAAHARKHAIRLHATAAARGDQEASTDVAKLTGHARSTQTNKSRQRELGRGTPPRRAQRDRSDRER